MPQKFTDLQFTAVASKFFKPTCSQYSQYLNLDVTSISLFSCWSPDVTSTVCDFYSSQCLSPWRHVCSRVIGHKRLQIFQLYVTFLTWPWKCSEDALEDGVWIVGRERERGPKKNTSLLHVLDMSLYRPSWPVDTTNAAPVFGWTRNPAMVLISSSLLFCTLLSPATNSPSPIVTKMSQSVNCASKKPSLWATATTPSTSSSFESRIKCASKARTKLAEDTVNPISTTSQGHQDYQWMEVALVSFVRVCLLNFVSMPAKFTFANDAQQRMFNWKMLCLVSSSNSTSSSPAGKHSQLHKLLHGKLHNFKFGWCKCALQNLERSREDHLWSSLPGWNPSVFCVLRSVSSMVNSKVVSLACFPATNAFSSKS